MEFADLQFCEYLNHNKNKLQETDAVNEVLDWANYKPGMVKLPANYVVPKVVQIIPPNSRDMVTDHVYSSIQAIMHAFKREHNQRAIQKFADLTGFQIDE